jgi:dTDP-L-rhamnose 4-epimerase
MKVLITGGAGFIGSHTADLLVEKGFEVRILDSLDPQIHKSKPSYLNPAAEFVKGDIMQPAQWKKCLEGVEAVIHLAAMTGIAQSMYEPARYFTINTVGTSAFYEVLLKNRQIRKQIRKIIVASSKTIYGEGSYTCKSHGTVYPGLRPASQLKKKEWEPRCPQCMEPLTPKGIKEDKPPQNLSIYALTKYDTERTSMLYGEALGIPTINFRYFSVFGPRQSLSNPYTGVCSIFLSRLKNGKPPAIFEDGNQLRDFVYVEDIARANLLGLEKEGKAGVYNIGSGTGTSINQIAAALTDILGSAIKPEVTGDFRIGDTRSDFADITKARKELGFHPKWTVRKGLESLVEWSGKEEAVDMFEKAEKERKSVFGG